MLPTQLPPTPVGPVGERHLSTTISLEQFQKQKDWLRQRLVNENHMSEADADKALASMEAQMKSGSPSASVAIPAPSAAR